MLKGQLSRIHWPGNSLMLFTFQPAFRDFSSPTNTPLANHTQRVHHYIQNALGTLSIPYRLVKHALTEIALLIIHVAIPLT